VLFTLVLSYRQAEFRNQLLAQTMFGGRIAASNQNLVTISTLRDTGLYILQSGGQ